MFRMTDDAQLPAAGDLDAARIVQLESASGRILGLDVKSDEEGGLVATAKIVDRPSDPNPRAWSVSLGLEPAKGGLVVRRVVIEPYLEPMYGDGEITEVDLSCGGAITTRLLRAVPLATIVARVQRAARSVDRQAANADLAAPPTTWLDMRLGYSDENAWVGSPGDAVLLADAVAPVTGKRRGRPGVADDLIALTADLYCGFVAGGAPDARQLTLEALKDDHGIPVKESTIKKYLKMARERGYLTGGRTGIASGYATQKLTLWREQRCKGHTGE